LEFNLLSDFAYFIGFMASLPLFNEDLLAIQMPVVLEELSLEDSKRFLSY
jgi:hypothetical protein